MLSLIINLILSAFAYLVGALTISGLFAATLTGTLILSGGGFGLYVILGVFFVTSSALTHYKDERKYHLYHLHEKMGKRDAMQVLANGAVPALCCVCYMLTHDFVWLIGAGIGIAAITSDTYGSELGVLSHQSPVSIINFKPIQTGLSGGVTWFGTLASMLGSFLIATLFTIWYVLFIQRDTPFFPLICYIGIFGFLGSVVDSLLGALVQVKYQCVECGLITENKIHHDQHCKQIKGIKNLNNDAVNLFSPLIVTLLGILLIPYISK